MQSMLRQSPTIRTLRVCVTVCCVALLAACDLDGEERRDATSSASPGPDATATTAIRVPTVTQVPAPLTIVGSPTAAPTLPQLGAGWTQVEPGGETACARGTPYAFWVRPGTVNRLLVFFQGGGGCWNVETCRRGSTFFDDVVNQSDHPYGNGGILDSENPENPFRDHYMVYIPSCTGDVYMGGSVHTYSEGGEEVTIHHKGFANGSSAMEWIYDHFSRPESLFVTGCSAGSVGSILFAPYLIRHYPGSKVYQLGDSLAYVFDHAVDLETEWKAHGNFPSWIPDVASIAPGEFTAAKFYSAIARFYPNYIFSQYNTAHDTVQQRFYFAAADTPVPAPWEDALGSSLEEIHAAAPNFRSYTAAGSDHCIMPLNKFYVEEIAGVRFRDWVADMAAGKQVPDVRCVVCD